MPTASLKVLVVEDDAGSRRLVQSILRSRGHDVEACADPMTAWEIARQERFDLAILDMRLPGMSGSELCGRLRKLPGGDELVILFLTGANSPDALEGALAAGADDYILKPINDSTLPVRLTVAERTVHFRRAQKKTEQRLIEGALRDSVTDLVNETLFQERLRRTARRAARERRKGARPTDYLYALLAVNLDGFGHLNTKYGYGAGNDVLREVGRRLEECVRAVDTVSRFQADLFVILLDDMNDVSDPTRVAQRIEQALAEPLEVDGDRVPLTACIGMAMNVGASDDPDQLLDQARQALARAKDQGAGTRQMFDVIVHARAAARIKLEARLRAAVQSGEMVLHYQPIVRLDSGRLAGFESLVRWNEPRRGLVFPDDFIPVAEETGVIEEIGEWALREAMRQIGQWHEQLGDPSLFVSVNMSGRHFGDRGSVELITRLLGNSDLPPGSLHIEITETALMTHLDVTNQALEQLKDTAVKIHVDDFGTGYSSLSYLCQLPIDSLKIDRSFVSRMTHSPENLEVVRTITQLASNLGISVIAEGVETEGQLDELRLLPCTYGQGYLFGRPQPPEQVEWEAWQEAAPE